ncbi:acylphosphatase [Ancylobacter sp. IITR112]|uniref:acylphosphatase n=1 Tax=Ancylobacter sp. IITR112 TaxID=3138073 RepID=UPI00352B2C1D
MAERAATRLFVSGGVQGVGYRAWLAREAGRRGLEGWVRNRQDGRVEALVIASPAALAEFLDLCRRGPSAARVTDVAAQEETAPESDATGVFAIRPTL